jgi:hypothetical protein
MIGFSNLINPRKREWDYLTSSRMQEKKSSVKVITTKRLKH